MPQPISAEQKKGLLTFYTGLQTSLNSSAAMAASLGGEFLGMFNKLKEQCDSVLSKLGATDAVAQGLEFDSMLSCVASAMSGTQFMLGMALSSLDQARQNMAGEGQRFAAQLASQVPVKIEELVGSGELIRKATLDERIKNGELVPKDIHTEACSQAKQLGMTEGETRVRTELATTEKRVKLVGDRRKQVETASLPLPSGELESILGLEDAEFTAAQAKAKTRNEFLTTNRITLNSAYRGRVWDTDGNWALVEAAVKEIVNSRGGSHEPFAGGGGGDVKRPRASV